MNSPVSLAAMRAAQVRSFNAVITRHACTAASDDVGDSTPTYADTEGIACGFAFESGSQRDAGSFEVIEWDATCRLPLTQAIEVIDEITLTELAGIEYALRFEIVKAPELGPTAQNIRLRRSVP